MCIRDSFATGPAWTLDSGLSLFASTRFFLQPDISTITDIHPTQIHLIFLQLSSYHSFYPPCFFHFTIQNSLLVPVLTQSLHMPWPINSSSLILLNIEFYYSYWILQLLAYLLVYAFWCSCWHTGILFSNTVLVHKGYFLIKAISPRLPHTYTHKTTVTPT